MCGWRRDVPGWLLGFSCCFTAFCRATGADASRPPAVCEVFVEEELTTSSIFPSSFTSRVRMSSSNTAIVLFRSAYPAMEVPCGPPGAFWFSSVSTLTYRRLSSSIFSRNSALLWWRGCCTVYLRSISPHARPNARSSILSFWDMFLRRSAASMVLWWRGKVAMNARSEAEGLEVFEFLNNQLDNVAVPAGKFFCCPYSHRGQSCQSLLHILLIMRGYEEVWSNSRSQEV